MPIPLAQSLNISTIKQELPHPLFAKEGSFGSLSFAKRGLGRVRKVGILYLTVLKG